MYDTSLWLYIYIYMYVYDVYISSVVCIGKLSTGDSSRLNVSITLRLAWASCQICKITGCVCAGNAGNVPLSHQCTPGSLITISFEVGDRETRSRHSRRMRKPEIYVSSMRPMDMEYEHILPQHRGASYIQTLAYYNTYSVYFNCIIIRNK